MVTSILHRFNTISTHSSSTIELHHQIGGVRDGLDMVIGIGLPAHDDLYDAGYARWSW